MGGVFPYDLPGIPENRYFQVAASPYILQQESYALMESKPYPRPLVVGSGPVRNQKWAGYRNRMVAMKTTNALSLIVPRIPINRQNFNANIPFPTNAAFAGQAPTRGIYTGVSDDEVMSCR